MEFQDLRLFVSVVDKGSFTRAAEQEDLPTSTLSRRLRKLEDELGVRLLERTTRRVHPTELGEEFYQRSLQILEEVRAEHGCGSLRLAYTADEVDWLKQTVSVGASLGFPMEIVGPDEIRAQHPFYNLDGVQAALHTPDDGHVDPAGAAFALAAGARQLGVKIVRRCRATGTRRATVPARSLPCRTRWCRPSTSSATTAPWATSSTRTGPPVSTTRS